ncbi:hemolysin-type calcium-binding protein [Nostoc sp. NIES-4103]|nr:hemolysin-type calcium-binding protein [Nostoc sp. NIES-4103]
MVNYIYGTSGNDTLAGTVIDDYIYAGGGNDSVNGGAGNDSLDGDTGNDTLNGGDGDDSIEASDSYGTVNVEQIDGGQGFDYLSLDNSAATSNLSVTYTNSTNGTVSNGTTFKNIESLRLETGSGNDTINVTYVGNANIDGNVGNDSITTGNGSDNLYGGSGNDTLNAGAGNDTLGNSIYGEAGNDVLNAGDGDDSIYLNDGNLNVEQIDGGQGFDYVQWDVTFNSTNLTFIYTNSANGTVSNGSTFKNIESLELYTGNGNDTINVTALGNAEIYTNGGNDSITTGNGNDTLEGGDGNDTLNAGAGNDRLSDGAGNDILNGGDGDDNIYINVGSAGVETINGGQGFDYLELDIGDLTSNLTITYTNSTNGTVSNGTTFKNIESLKLVSGTANDTINVTYVGNANIAGNAGNDSITTGNGYDTLDGGNGNDTLNAGAGNDRLSDGAGNDILNGGDGDDNIYINVGSAGVETINGGQGFDYLELDIGDLTSNLTITYTNSTNGTVSNGTTFKNIESLELVSGSGNDTINVTYVGNANITGNAGNDSITTGNGRDTLYGGSGNDTLNAGAGNDILGDSIYGDAGNDVFNAGDGDDSIEASDSYGTVNVEQIDGGQGYDYLSLDNSAATSNLSVTYTNSTNGTVSNGTTFKNIESLRLETGSGNDTINVTYVGNAIIYGNGGNDSITTGNGNDYLYGGSGNDTLNAGAGNDTLGNSIYGEAGNDVLNAGDGNDTIYASDGSLGVEQIDGGQGFDYLSLDNSAATSNLSVTYTNSTNGTVSNGTTFKNIESLRLITGSGNDTINVTVAGNAIIYGNGGNDSITTGNGNDNLSGGAGNDTLNAGADNDALYGGAGNDSLNAGAGNDFLDGGDGNDVINGGNGDDEIDYGGILASPGVDTIDGGLGNDSLDIDFSLNSNNFTITYTNTASGSISNGTTFKNIERLSVETYTGNDTINVSAATYANVQTNAGNDSITTGGGNDYLAGGNGNDTLTSGAGDDYISDGYGVDTIVAGTGNDRLDLDISSATTNLTVTYTSTTSGTVSNGTTFRDIDRLYLTTGIGNDNINVTAANFASVNGGVGNDTITTGIGDDTLTGDDGNDSLNSGAGDDNLYGGYGNDTLNARAGNDYLSGGAGNDSLSAGAGNDSLYDGSGVDTISGGSGYDYLNLNFSNYIVPLTVTYTSSTNGTVSTGTNFREIESLELEAGSASDIINVTAAVAEIYGGYGNDSITTGAGNDTIYGGTVLSGYGNDTINASAGNDYIYDGRGGVDSIDGGAGFDFLELDLSNYIVSLTVNYTNTTNGTISNGTTLKNIESLQLYTGDASDVINVSAAAVAEIRGGYGNDSITTGAGNDTIYGGTLLSGYGNDTINAGAGNDYIYDGEGGVDSIDGGAGYDYLSLDLSDYIVPLTVTYTTSTNGAVSNGSTFKNIESLSLTTGSASDSINITAAVVSVSGGYGNDSITTGAGNDNLNGGDGNDTLNAGAGDDTIDGGGGIDSIAGGAGYDYLNLDLSNYIVPVTVTYTNTSSGTVSNGTTFKEIEYLNLTTGSASDTINVTAAVASVSGGYGNDSITTGAGNDNLSGGDGNDTLNAGAGDDTIYGGAGIDSIAGGAGYDYLNLDLSNYIVPLTVTYTNTGSGTVSNGTTFKEIESLRLITGSASDSINVTAAVAYVEAGYGNDSITTGAGNDTLYGGDGNDTLNAGAGNDYIDEGAGVNTIDGGTGSDYLELNLSNYIASLTVTYTSLTNGTVSNGTTFKNIEGLELYTGNANDTINVSAASYAEINGGDGNDAITSGAGDDTLNGGYGNDSITSGTGDDTVYGGLGNDTINAGDGDDSIYDGAGVDNINGGSGVDYLNLDLSYATTNLNVSYTSATNGTVSNGTIFQNIESLALSTGTGNDVINVTVGVAYVEGNSGNDSMTTGAGNDTLSGGFDNDTLNGGNGNDILYGGYGSDSLIGGAGDDVLVGGFGYDTLTGGAGNDYFVYSEFTEYRDTITDFNTSADAIVLTSLLENAGYVGSDAIAAGYVKWIQSGTNTLVQIDVDGSAGTSEGFGTLVTLNNITATNVTASNFVL